MRERERERETRQSETETQREGETDRQTEREPERARERERERNHVNSNLEKTQLDEQIDRDGFKTKHLKKLTRFDNLSGPGRKHGSAGRLGTGNIASKPPFLALSYIRHKSFQFRTPRMLVVYRAG